MVSFSFARVLVSPSCLVATSGGPVAALRGRLAALRGRLAALSGPVASPNGPIAASTGPVAASIGPFTAEPPSNPPAEPPSRPATKPPSRPAAKPPNSRAAEPPSSRADEPPSRRAAEPPSSRAAEPPCRRAAIVPTNALWPYLLGQGRAVDFEDLVDDLQLRLALRLPLAGDAAPARARGARALEGLAGAVEVVVEAVEGVGVVVRVVAGVEVSVAAVEAEEAVAVAEGAEEAEVAEAAEASVELVAALRGGPRQQQQRSRETPSPKQLREWYTGRQRGGGTGCCTYLLRTGDRADMQAGVAIFDLDYDAILVAMYVVSTSDEGDRYLCVLPDPGIEAAALGASAYAAPDAGESALSGTTSDQALHTFTLDSGASRSFFRDRTTLIPLSRPVTVSLADPSGGPVLASFSTVLPCPAAPFVTLSGLYLPLFSTNMVSGADLQDRGVDQFTRASQRVTHYTCARTDGHFATFTRQLVHTD
ncbi:unnamed protein product [Closterium sp. NIES-65]|nr:unnamed protein product [Closterium sp. NIES-65]